MAAQDDDSARPEGPAVRETIEEKDREIGEDELDAVVGGLTPGWGTCTESSCPTVL